jgi:competence protein ComEA
MYRYGVSVFVIGVIGIVSLSLAWAGRNQRVLVGKLNINTASRQDLQLLPGIGEVRAHNIVRFREQIAGFKAIADLQRVPDVSAALFARVQDYLSMSGDNTLKVLLDLNSASRTALERLPNISRQQAQAIIAFRERNEGFKQVEDLLLIGALDAQRVAAIREWVTVLPFAKTAKTN